MFRKKRLGILMLGLSALFFIGCTSSEDQDTPDDNTVADLTKGEYKQKILIEDITSASCMWCPLGTVAIEGLENSEYNDRVVGVGVHGDFNSQMVKDPFAISGLNKLQTALKMTGWPHLSFNRNTSIKGTGFQEFLTQKSAGVYEFTASKFETFQKKYKLLNEGSPIGIKIESNLGATEGKVDFSLKFSQSINQELKYVVYILEDGLVFQQANATAMFGNTSGEPAWTYDFVHDHVVRATNNLLGETIVADQTKSSNEYKTSVSLSYTLNDISKASVVVVILDSKGKVLNTQKAKANTTQDYEKK